METPHVDGKCLTWQTLLLFVAQTINSFPQKNTLVSISTIIMIWIWVSPADSWVWLLDPSSLFCCFLFLYLFFLSSSSFSSSPSPPPPPLPSSLFFFGRQFWEVVKCLVDGFLVERKWVQKALRLHLAPVSVRPVSRAMTAVHLVLPLSCILCHGPLKP